MTEHAGLTFQAKKFGMSIHWNGPRGGDNTAQQIALIHEAISRGAVGIIISPYEPFALDSAIQSAMDAKIPVIVFGSQEAIRSSARLSYVLSDSKTTGQLAAAAFCSDDRKPKSLALIGIDASEPANNEIARAFEYALKACSPGVHVLHSFGNVSTYMQSEALVRHILSTDASVDSIFSLGVIGTRGAASALTDMQRKRPVRLVGVNYSLELLQLLRQKRVDAIVAPNMRAMAIVAVDDIQSYRETRRMPASTEIAPFTITSGNLDTPEMQEALRMDWR